MTTQQYEAVGSAFVAFGDSSTIQDCPQIYLGLRTGTTNCNFWLSPKEAQALSSVLSALIRQTQGVIKNDPLHSPA